MPPYLLMRLSQGERLGLEPDVAAAARATLAMQSTLRGRREARSVVNPPGSHSGEAAADVPTSAGIVPDRLRRNRDVTALRAPSREQEREHDAVRRAVTPDSAAPQRSIHDAEHRQALPGVLRRTEAEPAHPDESVNEAYDGLGYTWTLFREVYERDSLDGAGLPLVATVHFARNYDNAFWDGEQMVFGDGDGEIFGSFTDCVDVIAHELTHGFTQFTSGFVYVGQSGALNEHVSDVFGALTLQHQQGRSAEQADWLIGKGLFLPSVHGEALRSMRAPGTAYDDPRLGRDPQPATMTDFVVLPHDDAHDNGGVHINSGIPNHAFYLAATAIGGNAWESAGRVWYDVMVSGSLPKDCTFAAFAQACITAATTRFGADTPQTRAIASAWQQVGVLDTAGRATPVPTGPRVAQDGQEVWERAALKAGF